MKRFFFNNDQRSVKQYQNIFKSFFFKGISVASSFAIIPLCLSFLSKEDYGVWLTIYSVVGWTAFFDLGLGNGMKNKLIEFITLNNLNEARKVVSTGYILLFVIILTLIALFSLFHISVNWNHLLNNLNNKISINNLVYVCFVLFCLKLFFDLINQILLATQNVYTVNLISGLSNIGVVIALFIISKFIFIAYNKRLFIIGSLMSLIPVIVLFFVSIYFFSRKYKYLRPSISLFTKKYARNTVVVGGQFFVIQISGLIIFSTDNIIISKIYSSADVTIYNIAYKLFSLFTIVWGIILAPYWTAFREAYVLSDYAWIKKTMLFLHKLWILLQIGVIVLLFFVNYIYSIWVGEFIRVPINLSIFMAVFICLSTYCNIYAFLLNGIGKIRIQIYSSILAALINIPLAIFFSKGLNFGLSGIILATSVSLSIGAILQRVQYKKIMLGKAIGIWNA